MAKRRLHKDFVHYGEKVALRRNKNYLRQKVVKSYIERLSGVTLYTKKSVTPALHRALHRLFFNYINSLDSAGVTV